MKKLLLALLCATPMAVAQDDCRSCDSAGSKCCPDAAACVDTLADTRKDLNTWKSDSSGRRDAAALAASINHHVQQFSADVARVLGVDLCERLYAFPPDRKIDLVNPAILAAFDNLLT